MQRLKANEFIHLTDSIIRVLTQNRITTILEFLQEDTDKLSSLTNLSLPQVLDVRSDILFKYSAPLVNGTAILVNNVLKKKFINSGIQSLDKMLGGGIPTGYITEVCGLAESGKTQLCLQLAINIVKNDENTVLYVDTKGDFSASRIQKILDACGSSYKEMAHIMFKIRVVNVWTMDDILELFKKIKNKTIVIKNLSLIIVDSLPCLMFQHLGDDNKVGLTFLNTLVNYKRYLCKELDIGLVCVNIQTRWIEQDVFDIDNDGEPPTMFKEPHTEKRNRCLGKYWQHIPASVIILEKNVINDVQENSTQISASVVKLFGMKCDRKCDMKISNLGVTQ